jgi:hypothetical protein
MHPGGGYPLLRVAARFLRVDYTRVMVGFRTVADSVFVVCADPDVPMSAEAWAVVEFAGPTSPAVAEADILLARSTAT